MLCRHNGCSIYQYSDCLFESMVCLWCDHRVPGTQRGLSPVHETRYLGYALFTMVLFGVLGVVLQASGAVERVSMYTLRSLLIVFGTLITVLLLLVSKVYYMVTNVKAMATMAGSALGNQDSLHSRSLELGMLEMNLIQLESSTIPTLPDIG
mmetsp:Transcript_24631/g.61801  ORF Transcript_24631/g.61801 Transcript_24631/m.61801 type:complete len:152 (+) Transcript_24631:328-783(+)